MKRVLLQSCSVALLLFAGIAHAELYKWVGPDGKVTYSDVPPPKSATRVETKALGGGGPDTAGFPYELAEAVKNQPVTLYTTSNCTPCDSGRKLLKERGIPFSEKTVTSNEDIAKFREIGGGDGQLPLLAIGRSKEQGFETGAWNRALTAAGYPESSKLPRNYVNPPAEAAAPAAKPQTAKQDRQDNAGAKANGKAASTDLPPAVGNAPPGFRF